MLDVRQTHTLSLRTSLESGVAPVMLGLLLFYALCIQNLFALSQLREPRQRITATPGERSAYISHWERLLLEEYEYTSSQLREQRKTWSRKRLEDNGVSVFGAIAEPDTELFGEKIVRVVKPGESRFRDRFTRGDVLLLTPNAPMVDPVPRECIVVDVGRDWMSVGVGRSWPPGLWESRKIVGFYEAQLHRAAPQGPLKAQRNALESLRFGYAGEAAELMARLFQNTTEADQLAGSCPATVEVAKSESAILKGLDAAKTLTPFKPNESQEQAILWALQRRLSLIRGPPGTGKTRVAAMLISTALNTSSPKDKAPRILAVTHSNGAADVLLEALLQMGVPAVRLGRPASVSPKLQHRTVEAMAERMPEVKKLRRVLSNTAMDNQRRSAAAYELRQGTIEIQDMITRTAPVVVASCIGAHQLLNTDSETRPIQDFSLLVLDEAAQTTEPALMCALVAAKADQAVLVGDTRQLPPTITYMELRDTLGVSPMARLENAGIEVFTLETQYRMAPSLLEHPSRYFYDGLVGCAKEVEASAPPKGFPWPSKSESLAFVQVGSGDAEVQHNFGGRSNPSEASAVCSIVANVLATGDIDTSQIAVISPYSKQVQLIQNELSNHRNNLHMVRVGTVDSFQGQETDFVIISAVRSNPLKELGFLRDSRRLCVAITRARRGLVIVGDRAVLQSCKHWAALLKSCDERECAMTSEDISTTGSSPRSQAPDLKSRTFDGFKLFDDDDSDEFGSLFSPSESDASSSSGHL